MQISAIIKVVETKASDGYRHDEYENELFSVHIEASSGKGLEEKIGLLQQAVTHMGWKLK